MADEYEELKRRSHEATTTAALALEYFIEPYYRRTAYRPKKINENNVRRFLDMPATAVVTEKANDFLAIHSSFPDVFVIAEAKGTGEIEKASVQFGNTLTYLLPKCPSAQVQLHLFLRLGAIPEAFKSIDPRNLASHFKVFDPEPGLRFGSYSTTLDGGKHKLIDSTGKPVLPQRPANARDQDWKIHRISPMFIQVIFVRFEQ